MCFVYISEQTAMFALSNIKLLVFINETKNVYCAVGPGFLNKKLTLRLERVNVVFHSPATIMVRLSTIRRERQQLRDCIT
jgi:hypothetical protein